MLATLPVCAACMLLPVLDCLLYFFGNSGGSSLSSNQSCHRCFVFRVIEVGIRRVLIARDPRSHGTVSNYGKVLVVVSEQILVSVLK